MQQRIEEFLRDGPYAVVGASRDRRKYGNKVLRCYLQHRLPVYPVNPHAAAVEGLTCYPDLRSLPLRVRGVSIITPPEVTERIAEDLPESGATHAWLQPGAEGPGALRRLAELGIRVIAGGPCLLVVLGFRE